MFLRSDKLPNFLNPGADSGLWRTLKVWLSTPRLVLVSATALIMLLSAVPVYRLAVGQDGGSDYSVHIAITKQVKNGERMIAHPGFHATLIAIEHVTSAPWEGLVVLLVTVSMTASFLVQVWILRRLSEGSTRSLTTATLIGAALCVIMPIHIPGIMPNVFHGQLSPNLYHNPTYLMMKPLALLAFGLTAVILSSSDTAGKRAWLPVVLIMGMVIKPSFVIVYLPALWLTLIFTSAGQSNRVLRLGLDFREGRWCFALSLAAVTVLAVQYLYRFAPTAKSQLVFDFLEHWSLRSSNIPLSIILALAFPICVAAFRFRHLINQRASWLAVFVLLIGMAFYATLTDNSEVGKSNLGWSYCIAQATVFLAAAAEYLRWQPREFKDRLKYGTTSV